MQEDTSGEWSVVYMTAIPLQYVENAHDGEERVIRECAYTGENVNGQKRTGIF